jgi:hypothetical protein
MLLMLGSMRTRSFSLRAMVSGARSTSGDDRASTSGTLWRSAVCDAKLERQRAAVKLLRTAWRYGRSDCDCGNAVSAWLVAPLHGIENSHHRACAERSALNPAMTR